MAAVHHGHQEQIICACAGVYVRCVFVQEIKVVGPAQEQNPSSPIADVPLICLLAVKGGKFLWQRDDMHSQGEILIGGGVHYIIQRLLVPVICQNTMLC